MNLIIVESPTKAKTLSRFLKGKYAVEATMGHIRDLPKAALGVDVTHDFKPSYIVPRDKQKRVTELRQSAAVAEQVILATDPDREGEAIAWHTAELLSQPKKNKTEGNKEDYIDNANGKYSRIVFHEITESA